VLFSQVSLRISALVAGGTLLSTMRLERDVAENKKDYL